MCEKLRWNTKQNKNISGHGEYNQLVNSIGELLDSARKQIARTINTILIETYWKIGKRIVEYEQKGGEKADYGTKLLTRLSKDLRLKYGKGFSKSNVYLMRLLYIKYPKFQTLSGKLSWSHYVELLGITDDLARSFYEEQCFLSVLLQKTSVVMSVGIQTQGR